MSSDKFALPGVGVGPFEIPSDYYGDEVLWFRTSEDLSGAAIDLSGKNPKYPSWLLYDKDGGCWRITTAVFLPPEGTGWRQRIAAFFGHGRRFHFDMEQLAPVPFDEVRQRVCAAYANERNLVWECLGIDRKLEWPEEVRAAIDGEVQRLAEAKDLPDLIDRLQDLDDRRAAEAH